MQRRPTTCFEIATRHLWDKAWSNFAVALLIFDEAKILHLAECDWRLASPAFPNVKWLSRGCPVTVEKGDKITVRQIAKIEAAAVEIEGPDAQRLAILRRESNSTFTDQLSGARKTCFSKGRRILIGNLAVKSTRRRNQFTNSAGH